MGYERMSVVPPIPNVQIESLSRALGKYGSGSEISSVLTDLNLYDHSDGDTKWRRLNEVFRKIQERDGCANAILAFIRTFLAPARFVSRTEEFEENRQEVNVILAFSGLEYGADGEFRRVRDAKTLTEAERRTKIIRSKLEGRRIHPEALKYCRSELMDDNYFHAVFEATKGLTQRIRELSGVDGDGAALVDQVFSAKSPVLAFNTLRIETERSEHRGFAALLKGCFAAVRNPLAHEPKILWDGEDDAADYFTLVSLLHRKLDDCFVARLRNDQ